MREAIHVLDSWRTPVQHEVNHDSYFVGIYMLPLISIV